MLRQGRQICLMLYYYAKLAGSNYREKLARIGRIARIQARYPAIQLHPTADIRILGRLDVRGSVNVGRNTRIYVEKDATLVLGGRNMILDNVVIGVSRCLEIGQDVSIQSHCILLGDVSIGDGTILAPNVYISSGTHQFKGSLEKSVSPWIPIKTQDALIPKEGEKVTIGRDCWIGINCSCMPGSIIEDGCIIGANSVVTRTKAGTWNYSVYAGSPARLIGYRWISTSRQISTRRN